MAKQQATTSTKNNNAVVMSADMSVVPDYIDTKSGRGNENVGGELQIPRLKQLQKASNEVDKHHPDFVKGAEEGDWFDTVQKKSLGQSIRVVSVNFQLNFVVWKNRAVGGSAQKLGEFSTAEDANAAVAAQDQQDFEKDGVKILGEANILNRLPISASKLYSKNVFNFISNLFDKQMYLEVGFMVLIGFCMYIFN